MPLFKGCGCKGKPAKAIDYITDEKKAAIVTSHALDDNRDYAQQFAETAKLFGKAQKYNSRKYYHFKHSFDPKDNITPEEAHRLTEKLAQDVFPDNEYIIATHTDRNHIHCHIIVNTIYYSDDYFRHSSTEYDEHLATLSCIMTNFSVPLDNPSSLDSDWYLKQPERLYGFFGSIGFKDFETNEDYVSRSRFDSIGVGCANKQVDDYTVIGVGIRSGGYFREWSNNVYLGDGTKSDYMHEGWYNAANKTIDFIDEYISANRITGKIKVWIAGFSRGGATTNLAAGLLDNRIKNNEELFSIKRRYSHP